MTLVPPSGHPSGRQYEWRGRSLLDIEPAELPLLTTQKATIIAAVVRSDHAKAIIEGAADVKAHQAMLSLTSSGIAKLTDNVEWLAECMNALFHHDYAGNTRAETPGMLRSAKEKGLGNVAGTARPYVPDEEGPIALGYTRDGNLAFRDQTRSIVVVISSGQLLSPQHLLGLAPSQFWAARYPSEKGLFSAFAAGEALMEACRLAGPFNPRNIRGRGIWLEEGRIIVNLGDPVPRPTRYQYLCFEPLKIDGDSSFDTGRLLQVTRTGSSDALQPRSATAVCTVCPLQFRIVPSLATSTRLGLGRVCSRPPLAAVEGSPRMSRLPSWLHVRVSPSRLRCHWRFIVPVTGAIFFFGIIGEPGA